MPSGSIAKFAHYAAVVLAIAFLGAIAGSYLVFVKAAPSRYLTDAYRGGHALLDKWRKYDQAYPTEFWQPVRSDQAGVTVHDPARASAGVTLYTSGDGAHAVLVSMTGDVLHEWRLPFSEVWDETRSGQGAAAQLADLLPQGAPLPQRRPAGDLRGRGRHAVGLWPRQDRQELAADLEISGARAP